MPGFYTHYWTNETWEEMRELSGKKDLLMHTASNMFCERHVESGDIVYVVTVIKGKLYLLGKMQVVEVCTRERAAELLGDDPENLWEANDHIVAESATTMNFDNRVPDDVVISLRFASGTKVVPLKFKSPGIIDQQTLRGVRELSSLSATKLDSLLPEMKPVKLNK